MSAWASDEEAERAGASLEGQAEAASEQGNIARAAHEKHAGSSSQMSTGFVTPSPWAKVVVGDGEREAAEDPFRGQAGLVECVSETLGTREVLEPPQGTVVACVVVNLPLTFEFVPVVLGFVLQLQQIAFDLTGSRHRILLNGSYQGDRDLQSSLYCDLHPPLNEEVAELSTDWIADEVEGLHAPKFKVLAKCN
ncbi:hypothetical protein E4U12_001132, partial [Claviceps purpurea]